MAEITFTPAANHKDSFECFVSCANLAGILEPVFFALITTFPSFAEEYAPIMLTFSMRTGYMPHIPQCFATTMKDAREIVTGVGELFALAHNTHLDEIRAEAAAHVAADRAKWAAAYRASLETAEAAARMGTGTVADDDEESLVFADESGEA